MKNFQTLVLLLSFLSISLPGHAAYTVYGSGTGTAGEAISATAVLSLDTYDFGSGDMDALKIILTNTADTTSLKPNLLTGFFFSLSGNVGSLATTSDGFDGLAATVRTNTTSIYDVDIAPATNKSGKYQLDNNDGTVDGNYEISNNGTDFSAYDYGIATVAYGLWGFNGADVGTPGEGQDNYGIAAKNIDLSETNYPNLPVIDYSATFWIFKPTGLTSIEEQFTIGRFTYGSLPDNELEATPIPEPATMFLFGTGLVGLAGVIRRRKK